MNITCLVTNNYSFCIANSSCNKFLNGFHSLPITTTISISFSFLSSFLLSFFASPSLFTSSSSSFHPFGCSTPFLYLSVQIYIAYRHLIGNTLSVSPSFNFCLKPWVIYEPSSILHLPPQVHPLHLKTVPNFYTLPPEHTHTPKVKPLHNWVINIFRTLKRCFFLESDLTVTWNVFIWFSITPESKSNCLFVSAPYRTWSVI